MLRAQRLREAIPVRSMAWGGLAAGLSLALFLMVVLPFWWNVGASVVAFGISYVAAANIANSLGDAIGYRWGQRVLEKRWQAFVTKREKPEGGLTGTHARPRSSIAPASWFDGLAGGPRSPRAKRRASSP